MEGGAMTSNKAVWSDSNQTVVHLPTGSHVESVCVFLIV